MCAVLFGLAEIRKHHVTDKIVAAVLVHKAGSFVPIPINKNSNSIPYFVVVAHIYECHVPWPYAHLIILC